MFPTTFKIYLKILVMTAIAATPTIPGTIKFSL